MKKTITFLMSFGHCGIDWLHSLLDSHPQILIMPAFSFYRTWKILDASSIEDVKGMHTLWDNYFINKNTQHNENHFFINNNEQDLFSNQLMNELTNFGISRQDTLWAIIKSYAVAKNIDLNKIKMHADAYFVPAQNRWSDAKNILRLYLNFHHTEKWSMAIYNDSNLRLTSSILNVY